MMVDVLTELRFYVLLATK